MWAPMALGVPMLAAVPAAAQVAALDQVSAGADAVLVVPNLQQLSTEIAEFRQALNLPVPELDDALASFKQETGMVNGIDDAGSMLVVMPDLAEAMQGEREPQVLVLMPVSDYGAFVGNFGGQADGTTALTMPGGEPGFAKKVGDYAVMGQTQAAVDAYQPGNATAKITQSVGALGQRYLNTADALFYVDMAEVGPTAMPALERAVEGMVADMEAMAAGGAMDANTVGQSKAMFNLYGEAGKAFLRDANGVIVTLDLGAKGVGLTSAVAYKDGSTLAQIFPGGGDGPALGVLPDKPFIFAGAWDGKAVNVKRLYQNMLDAMPDGSPGKDMAAKWLPLMDKFGDSAAAFYAPDQMAMMSGSFMNILSVVETPDAGGFVGAFKDYVQSVNGFSMPIPAAPEMAEDGEIADPAAPEAGAPAISYTSSYTDNVLQLEGQKVDQYQIATQFPPEMMAQMGPAAGFAQMFGTYSGYVTSKGDHAIVTTTPDPQLVTQALSAVDNAGGLGAAGPIAQIREEAMPPRPVAQFYVGVDGIAQSANVAMQMFGAAPINVPPGVPPIASGLAIEESSMAYRTYVPIDTIKFVMDAVMQVQGQFAPGMGGPGGPVGPGGGPPPF